MPRTPLTQVELNARPRAMCAAAHAWYDATTDRDLRVPPSNDFEKLHGNLAGFHSIRVNTQWRLIFRWDDGRGEAAGLYLDDHSYV